jgi:transcriptional regulator with XRE-family HTH domain
MAELGGILQQARASRGLTLEDAERDTRISKRYLEALEREDFAAFPAPFYTRAFLRTYGQYLGLDVAELLRTVPHDRLEPEVPPLPELTRPPTPVFSINWVVAGVVILFLFAAGLLLYRSGSGGENGTPAEPLAVATTAAEAAEQPAPELQATVVPPTEQQGAGVPAEGNAVVSGPMGTVPDLEGSDLESAVTALRERGLDYVVVEVENTDVPEGLIFDQNPGPGAEANGDAVVTLVVSRGG